MYVRKLICSGFFLRMLQHPPSKLCLYCHLLRSLDGCLSEDDINNTTVLSGIIYFALREGDLYVIFICNLARVLV